MDKKLKRHLDTAKLLFEGIEESMGTWKKDDGWHYRYITPPENSKESVVRRCVQIRQELLQIIKELEKW